MIIFVKKNKRIEIRMAKKLFAINIHFPWNIPCVYINSMDVKLMFNDDNCFQRMNELLYLSV